MTRVETLYSHPKFFSSNQLFSNFISKNVVLTKFLPKKSENKFPSFPQCALRWAYFVIKIPWNQLFNKTPAPPGLNLTEYFSIKRDTTSQFEKPKKSFSAYWFFFMNWTHEKLVLSKCYFHEIFVTKVRGHFITVNQLSGLIWGTYLT